MAEVPAVAAAPTLSRWRAHKFLIMVAATIVASLVLVGVAMAMYSSSGAAQLDLSRPGYRNVSEQADRGEVISAFPSSGPIDQPTLNQFRQLYTTQAQQVLGYDGFGGDPMSDASLGLAMPSDTTSQPAQN